MAIELNIQNLYGGGAVERLHGALQEALQNILDPNTPAKKARKVKLEISIKPIERNGRRGIDWAYAVSRIFPSIYRQLLGRSVLADSFIQFFKHG